jgi:ATP-dependent DNA helicase RecG
MLRLDSDVQFVKGVGPRRASLLASRNIRTVEDLLLHIPKSYQDRASFVPLSSLRMGEDAAVHARVYRSRVIQTRTRGRIFEVILTDGTSYARAKWFHGGFLQTREFSAGRDVVLFGRVDFDRHEAGFVFFNPEFELLNEGDDSASLDIGRYVPIYEETFPSRATASRSSTSGARLTIADSSSKNSFCSSSSSRCAAFRDAA